MASRRTRIKGIANIPQRRKTTTTPTTLEEEQQAAPEIAQTDDETPNLTLCTPDVKEKGELEKVDVKETQVQQIKEESVTAPDEGVSERLDRDLEKIDKSDPKPSIPVRRKFIKPTVSLNAVSRKSKEGDDVKPPPPLQKQPKSNKIIVLNEIIAYPDSTEEVIIHNHSRELGNSLPEAPTKPAPLPQSNSLKPQINIERDIKRLAPSPQTQPSELEYPIPPPSPSKVNRSRIKATPNLGQRNTSFSASESEDESRRNYRHRNDSVCSTASGFQDSNSVAECPSPQKPKEFNSVIQRKCRRTEQSRKLAEARRDFHMKFGNKTPDRQKLTMIDLIFYNPTTNPMSHDKQKKENGDAENGTKEEKVDDPEVKSGSDEENEIPAPQIKIGPQGEIVVDEQSLVIESKAVKKSREELEKSKLVNGDFDTGYGVYKRAKRSKDWSKHETLKFYKALNTIGTDFTLMCELFPRRSRRELKMKFKKEERINKVLIDRAIMQPCGFDFNDFKYEVDLEEKELLELEKQKEREQQMKKEAKKRKASTTLKNSSAEKVTKVEEKPKEKKKKKALDIMNVLDDDDDDEESDGDESGMDESVFNEDEDQDKLMKTIQRPTRSGRVPKILDRYKAHNPEPKKAEPGSLIVVAGTGAMGEPVYRVCMVTEAHNRQQIGEDMATLSQALEYKNDSSCIKSIFTLSTTTLAEPVSPVEIEENITIPADEVIENDSDSICTTLNQEATKVEENNITVPADKEEYVTVNN